MFADLKKYRRIFVTGPHRSGTTICAKMIAHDTGHDLVLEDDFRYTNKNELAAFLYSDYGPQVIQCPFLSAIAHDIGYEFSIDMSECLVVMMHRYRRDIMRSEENARLKNGKKVNFEAIGESQRSRYYSDSDWHISDLKYEAWQDQCKMIPNALDVGYESLRDHPMWIESRNFSVRQTDENEEPDVVPTYRRMPVGFLDGLSAIQNN